MLTIHNTLRALALLPAAAFFLSGSAVQASVAQSGKFEIPFDFQVQKKTMPAGKYKVEQQPGSSLVLLINARTGESVQFVRRAPETPDGKTKLVFENGSGGHLLKRIS